MRPSRRTWLSGLLIGGLSASAGCLAPTLPVPPPSSPEVSAPDSAGLVTVKGGPGSARANAIVTVWNENLPENKGVSDRVRSDGSWQVVQRAKSKERLLIWQTVGGDDSNWIELTVP